VWSALFSRIPATFFCPLLIVPGCLSLEHAEVQRQFSIADVELCYCWMSFLSWELRSTLSSSYVGVMLDYKKTYLSYWTMSYCTGKVLNFCWCFSCSAWKQWYLTFLKHVSICWLFSHCSHCIVSRRFKAWITYSSPKFSGKCV